MCVCFVAGSKFTTIRRVFRAEKFLGFGLINFRREVKKKQAGEGAAYPTAVTCYGAPDILSILLYFAMSFENGKI